MNLRDLLTKYRNEIGSAKDLLPDRAAKVLTELSALLGNCLDEIRVRQATYNQILLLALDSEKSAARARIRAETSLAFMELKEAKDAHEVMMEIIRGLKFYLKAKQEEFREAKY